MSYDSTSSEAEMASSSLSSSASSSVPIVNSWKRRRTIPELLAIRQNFGKSRAATLPERRMDVPSSLLSYRGAWNPCRLQNMILAVGPGTPATAVMIPPTAAHLPSFASSASSASSVYSTSRDSDNENEDFKMEDDEDEEEEKEEKLPKGRAGWVRRPSRNRSGEDEKEEDEDDGDSDDDSDDDSDGDRDSRDRDAARRIVESTLLEWYGRDSGDDDSEEEDESDIRPSASSPVPSIRHGGCINTAAWLDCGWRLSTAGTSCDAVFSEECPTQLVTSGDDHLVKFWDVRHAMGMTSPLPGGYTTICPFSAPNCPDQDVARKSWKSHYAKTQSRRVAGSVLPLVTLQTGHRGNVFHVTPLINQPGKVATCGADGFLRLTDMETGDASVVVSPDCENDLERLLPVGLLSLRPGMCFSHHFLNKSTGLLCSERGLRRFDLRLPPREQPTESLLGGPFRACKACAVWSSPTTASSLEEGDSSYVFAGGSSADVTLCDLRMIDDSACRVVQHYRPSGLIMADHVSVSGLDLSRDRQELLVSYENDQIYTFPVFPQANSAAGSTLDPLRDLCSDAAEGRAKELNELAAYGGHLNRFTFLKNAKYAGPRDEYICTGSDSGHAWIYEKANGSVVAFLNADHSTCNGVVPHPSLPLFITYGIDSTAKLWRATVPVDPEVDDSPAAFLGSTKVLPRNGVRDEPGSSEMGEVQQVLKVLESEDCKETDILPDQIPSTTVLMQRGRFGRHFLQRDGSRRSRIGNDLHNLPEILKQNLYACLRSIVDGDDVPVESDIESLKHRISLIRLRHQADRLGILWNPSIPWALEVRKQEHDGKQKSGIHSSDLVPDAPSDWIPYDPEMRKSPWDFNNYFNTKEYGDFFRELYSNLDDISAPLGIQTQVLSPIATGEFDKDTVISECDKGMSTDTTVPSSKMVSSSSEEDDDDKTKYIFTVYKLLHETMLTLKDGGNAALQAGNLDLAACRYDKAIQYGAVALMTFPVVSLNFAQGRKDALQESGGYHLEWGPLIRVLIITRLNLALLMLNPHFSRPGQAVEQARLALHELKPFCVSKGKVVKGSKLDEVFRDDEPEETFLEAMKLQAECYFRLGSAQYDLGDYSEAIYSFEHSVKSTKQTQSKPDNLVLRRLSDAKRENRRRSKRHHRKKFKFDFGAKENQVNGKTKKES